MKAFNNQNGHESEKLGGIDRRQFLKTFSLGAAGLMATSAGLGNIPGAETLIVAGSLANLTPGLQPPQAAHAARMPNYNGPVEQNSQRSLSPASILP